MKAYTIFEIDRMRAAVRQMNPGSGPGITSWRSGLNGHRDPTWDVAENTNLYAWSSYCEEKLRTYMLAGIEPEALEEQAAALAIGEAIVSNFYLADLYHSQRKAWRAA